MLAELAPFGPHSQACRTLGNACFGRALFAILPEDDFDRQPLIGGGGRYLLTADVRIDNRAELAATLGLAPAELKSLSDASMLMTAWERWQVGCFDHLLGDVAVAVWDSQSRRLTLARTAISHKPLFYHQAPEFVAFATMPQGLFALPDIPKRLDLGKAAAIAAGFADVGSNTFFEGIRVVRQGQALEFTTGEPKVVPLWDLDNIASTSLRESELGDALRFELERAVTAQLRRRSGSAACQLSSGRDSSAVATTAALAMRGSGEHLLALTGAPGAGFAGPSIGTRLADESELAAVTAAKYPEITHIICRSRKQQIGPALRQLSERHYRPITNLSALHWAGEIDREACRRGASVMLIGWTGNHSISASGPAYLVDVLSHWGLLHWWTQARRIGGFSWPDWRGIARVTLGPFLPQSVYRQALRLSGRDPDPNLELPILRQPYRARGEEQLREEFRDPRPPRSFGDFRRSFLTRRDNSEKMSLALFGIDVRDPTGDRRLVELCLSFPPDQLASRQWAPSPVYEAAFKDRIPATVLYNRNRGYQGADWFELFGKQDVAAAFRRFGENRLVRELFDFVSIDRMVASWPEHGSNKWADLVAHRNQLLPALGLADFIALHFPN